MAIQVKVKKNDPHHEPPDINGPTTTKACYRFVMFPRDIVYLIAQHVAPDPVVFTRLAATSRDFYSVFTSDIVWAPLDAYAMGSGIFNDFIRRLPGFELILTIPPSIYMWVEGQNPLNLIKTLDNKYVQLMLACWASAADPGFQTERVYYLPVCDPHLLKLVAILSPLCHRYVKPKVPGYEEFALANFRARPSEFEGVQYHEPESGYSRFFRGERFTKEMVKFGFVNTNEHLLNLEPQELLTLFKADPRNLFEHIGGYEDSVVSGLRRAALDRKSILDAIFVEPKILNLFSELWHDREMRLAAFSGIESCLESRNTSHPEGKSDLNVGNFRFLGDISDQDKEKIIEIMPDSLSLYPTHFRDKKELLLRHLSVATVAEVWHWLDADGHTCPLLHDPEVVDALMARDLLRHQEHKLETYCPEMDDYDWVKSRISAHPVAWKFASARLRDDKELFIYAINESNHKSPALLSSESFQFASLPDALRQDKDVLKALAASKDFGYGITTREVDPELLRLHCRIYPDDTESFIAHHYEFAREIVLRDLSTLVDEPDFWNEFVEDPTLIPYLSDHSFDLYAYLQYRDYHDGCVPATSWKTFSKTVLRASGRKLPKFTREIARRMVKCNPRVFGSETFWRSRRILRDVVDTRWFDMGFVLEAIELSPTLFWNLPDKYLLDPMVQKAAREAHRRQRNVSTLLVEVREAPVVCDEPNKKARLDF